MSKENIGDFVAGEMSDILQSESLQQVFSKPIPVKTAAKKDDEDEDKKDKEKDEKKKEKDEKKKDKKSQLEIAIKGIAKISEVLDSHGLTKSAIATIRALEVIVSEAQAYGDDTLYAKDKKDDDDKKDDKKDEDKDEKEDKKDDKDEEKKDEKKEDKNDLDLFPGKAPGEGVPEREMPSHYPKTENPGSVPGGGYSEPKGEHGPEDKSYDYEEDQNKSDVLFAKDKKDDDKKDDDKKDDDKDEKDDKDDKEDKKEDKDDKKEDKKEDKNDACDEDMSYDKDKELKEGSEEIYELLEALGLSPDGE